MIHRTLLTWSYFLVADSTYDPLSEIVIRGNIPNIFSPGRIWILTTFFIFHNSITRPTPQEILIIVFASLSKTYKSTIRDWKTLKNTERTDNPSKVLRLFQNWISVIKLTKSHISKLLPDQNKKRKKLSIFGNKTGSPWVMNSELTSTVLLAAYNSAVTMLIIRIICPMFLHTQSTYLCISNIKVIKTCQAVGVQPIFEPNVWRHNIKKVSACLTGQKYGIRWVTSSLALY